MVFWVYPAVLIVLGSSQGESSVVLVKLRGDSDCLPRWFGGQFDPGLV